MTFDDICSSFRSQDHSRFIQAAEVLASSYAGGLGVEDIAELASAIAASGIYIPLPPTLAPFADIPSTGGPASLTTLFCPILLAAFDVRVPKISATGSIAGAIDTMAIIPGYRTALNETDFLRALVQAGIAHNAQTIDFCPADKTLIQVRRRLGMMRHSALAAASLLAKKLVVRGTASLLDFRLGPTGNIANTYEDAARIAQLFLDVATKLNISIEVAITSGFDFPCSALGRLESLALLHTFLRGNAITNELDARHLNACISLVCRAKELAVKRVAPHDNELHAQTLIKSGAAYRKFIQHLEAQGADEEGFEELLRIRERQRKLTLLAKGNGFWIAPDLQTVKTWFSRQQASLNVQVELKSRPTAERQLGLKILACPGKYVRVGQPVAEVRLPAEGQVALDISFLCGSVDNEERPPSSQVLGYFT